MQEVGPLERVVVGVVGTVFLFFAWKQNRPSPRWHTAFLLFLFVALVCFLTLPERLYRR